MTEWLHEVDIECPYCGEPIGTVLDLSAGGQAYVEDCQVCCRPILLRFTVDHAGELDTLSVSREDA
jgi:hypothetical protein